MAEQDENELYAKWLAAEPAQRGDIEAKLFAAVKPHAEAVLQIKLGEAPPDLVNDIATAVITQLKRFRRESKFSTWVQEIAQRKAKQYIRGKVRQRRVFDEYAVLPEGDPDDADDAERLVKKTPSGLPHLDGEIAVRQFVESLPKDDAALLRHKREGLDSTEIAEAMGTTVEAIDSRWARLKRRVKKFGFLRRK